MSIRLKIAGARKREKSELISFATCRSFYTKQFDSLWYCSVPHSKVVNPFFFFRIRQRKCCTSPNVYVFLVLLSNPEIKLRCGCALDASGGK